MPPWGSSGFGARRVQMTKPSGAGSPEATPSVNGSSRNFGAANAGVRASAANSTACPPARRRVRRLGGYSIIRARIALLMPADAFGDRKSVVEGKSVSVRVYLGGCGVIKKKKKK